MKRWDVAKMLAIGRTLFSSIHKKKRFANPNHEVHFMAREGDSWLMAGIKSIMDGSYTPRHLKRYYFKDEMVDQLHIADRGFCRKSVRNQQTDLIWTSLCCKAVELFKCRHST